MHWMAPTPEQMIAQAMELMRKAAAAKAGESPASPTVEELWDLYAEAKRETVVRWKTVECLMRPVIRKLGARAAVSLRPADLERYLSERAEEKCARGRAPSARTRNHELTRLIALLNWSADQGLISHNPIRRRPHVHVDKLRRPEWSEQDIDRLLFCADEMWFRSLVLVRIHTGLRPSEGRLLRWSWVHLRDGCIKLPAEATKTRTARVVSLTPEAVEALDAQPRGEYVFAQPDGKPWGTIAVYNRWRRCIEASGLEEKHGERITFHALRAIYLNTARRRGVDLVTRQAQVGHSSLATTGEYECASESDLRRGAAQFSEGARRERRGPMRSHRREMTRRRSA